jgi:hypothetical protein
VQRVSQTRESTKAQRLGLMETIDFQSFLGVPFGDIIIDFAELESSVLAGKEFNFRFKRDYRYFERKCIGFSIRIDDKDIIQKIEVYAFGHIDKPFYELFYDHYGLASEFLC